MTTVLLISGALVWWFVGLVSSQLIWRRLPNEKGYFAYEWGPFAKLGFFLLSLTGPLPMYLYLSSKTADRIEESQARKQVREEMIAERNRLRVQYYEKLLTEEGISADKWGDSFDLDTPME